MGISYLDARQLSVWEFNQRMKGIRRRNIEEWRRTRWMAATIINPHLKRSVRPDRLLPLPDDIPLPRMSPEEIEADVNRKMRLYKRINADK